MNNEYLPPGMVIPWPETWISLTVALASSRNRGPTISEVDRQLSWSMNMTHHISQRELDG